MHHCQICLIGFLTFGRGVILDASDPNLGSNYVVDEMELVLKLGLCCSHPDPMRQVMQFLEGDAPLPGCHWII